MQIRAVLANGKFWSGMLCTASFSIGTSYIQRPPVVQTLAGRAIETYLGYPVWGYLLLVTTVLIVIGHLLAPLRVLGVVGHLLGVLAYGTFFLSLGISSLFGGQAWANTGLYFLGVVLHVACAIFMADDIAKYREEVAP
jgi:hypothetical protein